MHNEDIRPGMLTPAQEDEIIQRSVLTEALVLYPAQLTILELALRVETDRRSCEQDAIERAVRELARDGLILCDCLRLSPAGPLCARRAARGRLLRPNPRESFQRFRMRPAQTATTQPPTHYELGSRAPLRAASNDLLSVLGATG